MNQALHPTLLLARLPADVVELFVYAGILLVLVIVLILVKIFMAVYTKRKLRNMQTPFGLSAEELDKMRGSSGLTEEEFKAVRAAMARKLLERNEEEARARALPAKADIILSTVPGYSQENSGKTVAAGTQVPISPRKGLPSHLTQFADSSEMELEQLLVAGFITRDEFLAVRDHQREDV